MYIHIDLESGRPPLLEDADSFKSFFVQLRGAGGRPLAEALAGVADGIVAVGDDLFVERSTVLRLAGDRPQRPDWMERFDGMLHYAAQHGWLSADGQRIQAHCEMDDPR